MEVNYLGWKSLTGQLKGMFHLCERLLRCLSYCTDKRLWVKNFGKTTPKNLSDRGFGAGWLGSPVWTWKSHFQHSYNSVAWVTLLSPLTCHISAWIFRVMPKPVTMTAHIDWRTDSLLSNLLSRETILPSGLSIGKIFPVASNGFSSFTFGFGAGSGPQAAHTAARRRQWAAPKEQGPSSLEEKAAPRFILEQGTDKNRLCALLVEGEKEWWIQHRNEQESF